MSLTFNSLFNTDGYKPGHFGMLVEGTTRLYGTLIPRSLKRAPKGITKIVSFGHQMTWKWIHDQFEENFFYTHSRNQSIVLSMDTERKAEFFNDIKQRALQFVKDMSLYLGMEYDGRHFEDLWDLGYLPIKVKALPEGIETGPNIPHMTFVNTVDGFAWLTLYLETIVSSMAWKSATAATIAKLYRRTAEEWVSKTDPKNLWLLDYMCHDFSARGLDPTSQYLIGLGHATSFRGSDTLPVIPASRYFYGEPEDEVCINSVNASEHSVSCTKIFYYKSELEAGNLNDKIKEYYSFDVPSDGGIGNPDYLAIAEWLMLKDWLKKFPKGILSVVNDTMNTWKHITHILPRLKKEILERDGKLVTRPDTGNPVDIICGTSSSIMHLEMKGKSFEDALGYELRDFDSWYDNPIWGITEGKNPDLLEFRGRYFKYGKDGYHKVPLEMYEEVKWNESINKGVIELLWDIFGGTINEQGYKILDPHIGAIYGDSITTERQEQIYERLASKGFAATNIVLGVGSFTYQYNTRDTLGFAVKASWFEVGSYEMELRTMENMGEALGQECIKKAYNIYKDPVTDDGTKKSLKGLLQVYEISNPHIPIEENGYFVKTECTPEEENQGLLQVIYEDGKFYNQTTLKQIREKLLL